MLFTSGQPFALAQPPPWPTSVRRSISDGVDRLPAGLLKVNALERLVGGSEAKHCLRLDVRQLLEVMWR
jgi:hypothetical protein